MWTINWGWSSPRGVAAIIGMLEIGTAIRLRKTIQGERMHLPVKRVIADLLGVGAAVPRFAAQISVLKEMVEHHAREEEEGKLFPTVRAATDGDYRAGLAGEMIALMVALDQEGPPRLAVRSETGRAAPV